MAILTDLLGIFSILSLLWWLLLFRSLCQNEANLLYLEEMKDFRPGSKFVSLQQLTV